MIKVFIPSQKSIFLLFGLLIASLFFIGCQQDPVEHDAVYLTTDANCPISEYC